MLQLRPLPPETLNLYATAEGFYFEPNYAYPVNEKPALQILRPSGTILVNERVSFNIPTRPSYNIYGVLGMIQLLSGPYLIVVKERKLACKLFGHYIWRITGTEILPCSNHFRNLDTQQRADETTFVELLKSFLSSDYLYYSSTFDLTRSIQAQVNAKGITGLLAANMKFVVNRYIASPFTEILSTRTDTRLDDFLIFCIEGFVELQPLLIHHKKVLFGLISRRATGRVGTRYHSRGIDDKGQVSNSVETEQIVVVEDELASFVQIRGSIPLFWRQNINIKYKPPLEFYNHSNMSKVFARHFADLIADYGPVTAVNLVSQSGWEGHLAREYSKQARELADPTLHYVPFDFNRQCRQMQWDRVSILINNIESDMMGHGYFRGKLDLSLGNTRLAFSEIETRQKGVVRTNCIDCLDRTNLVQGFIGRRAMMLQLREMGVLGPNETVSDCPALEVMFKRLWADNGDAISEQYSGTGALKADFTRTGRRTKRGLLRDGINSLIRYYLNNFTDGHRQDAMDLFYGHYTVRLDDYCSPFIYQFDRRLLFAPTLLFGSFMLMLYFGLISKPAGLPRFTLLLTVTLFVFSAILVLQNGIRYVQYPKLRPPPVISHIHPLTIPLSENRRRFFEIAIPSRKVHVI